MPLFEPDRLTHHTSAREDSIGVILTTTQLNELRVLKARLQRAQADIDRFWQDNMPGGVPGARQG